MITNRAAMYAAFEKEPGDLAGYAAMSDLLREDGWLELAHAFQWMQLRGKWPHKRERYASAIPPAPGRAVPSTYRWAWYAETKVYRKVNKIFPLVPRAPHSLPHLLLSGEQKVFRAHQEAVQFLAVQLALLSNTYRAELPKPASIGEPLILSLQDDGKIRTPPLLTLGEEEQ